MPTIRFNLTCSSLNSFEKRGLLSRFTTLFHYSFHQIRNHSPTNLWKKGLTESIPRLSTPGSLTLYFSKETLVPPLKNKFVITRCARMQCLCFLPASMDVYSLANQRHLKYPDLSTSENERLHPQCGLYMTILSSYPYVS